MIAAIRDATGLSLPDGAGGGVATQTKAAFGFAPGKFLVVDQEEGLASVLAKAVTSQTGTVTDLSHGRTVIRVSGPKAEWVLAKFFAIDFSLPAFPLGAGLSTVHHDIFAQIQRTGADQFDIYVFRSFARVVLDVALPRERRGRLRGAVAGQLPAERHPLVQRCAVGAQPVLGLRRVLVAERHAAERRSPRRECRGPA